MTTNLERIRQMTADELAEFLNSKGHCCEFCAYSKDHYCRDKYCIDGRKQWLDQESEG